MGMFKNRIKELRIERDLSQQDLANRLDVNKQTISQYERGVREPNFEKLLLLCDIFNVSSDYLLGKDSRTSRLVDTKERQLIDLFRSLDEDEKMRIWDSINSPSLSPEASEVARAYDQADIVTQMMVKRILGLETEKEKEDTGYIA